MCVQGFPPRVEAFYQVEVLRGWVELMARKCAGPRKYFSRAISRHPCAPWDRISYTKVSYIRARWLRHYI